MSRRKPPSPGGLPPGPGRTVTLDYLTAASHPDAVVTGFLLAVIGLLVLVGLAGLLEPVASLDLFRPDLGFGALVTILAQIAVAAAALVAAGLGLAKHPRFPAVYLGVATALTVLIALALVHWLTGAATLSAFPVLGALVVAAVPYVVFSRRCRLIFLRRLDVNDLKAATSDRAWTVTHGNAASAPFLPAPNANREPPQPRRARARKAVAAATEESGAAALTVPTAPPADPTGAALWAALYGPAAAAETPGEETEPAAGGSGSAGRRVGLEALINLRPPEST